MHPRNAVRYKIGKGKFGYHNMSKMIESLLKAGEAIADILYLGSLAELLTDPAKQQLWIDRVTTEGIVPDPRQRPSQDLKTAALLNPAYQVIPFDFRGAELDDYINWCAMPKTPLAIRLITGGSGRGKTRLMVELAGKLRDGGPISPGHTKSKWAAGFVNLDVLQRVDAGDSSSDPFGFPFAANKDLCLVIDYAENKCDKVIRLLKAAVTAIDNDRRQVIRIILIARQRTEIFDKIMQDKTLGERRSVEIVDKPLGAVTDPKCFFQNACDALDVPEAGRVYPKGLTVKPDFGILSLAALLAAAQKKPVTGNREDILNEILKHEKRYWEETAKRLGISKSLLYLDAHEIVAANLTFFGLQGAISDIDAGVTLISKLAMLQDQTYIVQKALVKSIADLYPHPDGRIEGVGLDLLADHFVAQMADKPFAMPTHSSQINSALTRTTWIARHRVDPARKLLGKLLAGAPVTGLSATIEMAQAVGDPLGQLAAQWLEENALDPKQARQLERELPDKSVALRELAVAIIRGSLLDREKLMDEQKASLLNNLGIRLTDLGQRENALEATQEAVDVHRHLVETQPNNFKPDLASSLQNLGNTLAELGRREDALEATQEGVELYRSLAETRPDAFIPDLAGSLNNLGNRLADLGKRETALKATQEAVDLYRHLTETQPDAFIPDLARSLNNLGISLAELGKMGAALEATQESVNLYRPLAETQPDAFIPDLASSLNTLGNRLADLGKREPALKATQEAVHLYRPLAETQPDAFIPDLAMSLNNLGNKLADLGKREDALEATQEAVNLRRALAETQPNAFIPVLAMSLNNLGNRLEDLGKREAALETAKEAVYLQRALVETQPDAFIPALAESLHNLSITLAKLGKNEAALEAAKEAVYLRRTLTETQPDAFIPDFACALNNLGNMLADLGEKVLALEATQEAVNLYRTLAETEPAAFIPDRASSLNNLGNRLEDLGKREDALEATQEAVNLYRTLVEARPDAVISDLAMSLNNLGIRLADLDKRENALEAIQEAMNLYRHLAETQPDAFIPGLARSLGALSQILIKQDQCREAELALHEALTLLRPFFLANAVAFQSLMSAIYRWYIELCEAEKRQPDADLLAPIITEFTRLGEQST